MCVCVCVCVCREKRAAVRKERTFVEEKEALSDFLHFICLGVSVFIIVLLDLYRMTSDFSRAED